jgi:hypothetical protein
MALWSMDAAAEAENWSITTLLNPADYLARPELSL